MLKIIKKNQLTILVISLMLVTAGYLNYNENIQTSTEIADIGDATLVSSNLSNSVANKTKETNQIEAENSSNEVASSVSTNEESIQTNSKVSDKKEYFNSSRLERDTMYSQMLESYQKILDSTTTSEKQKSSAQEEIDKINKTKNAIMISENLIKTKGFEDVIIFQNDDSISLVIDKYELNKEDIAQVQSIIAREMGADIEDIHIMNK
jgi:stage III sporulation protein AH